MDAEQSLLKRDDQDGSTAATLLAGAVAGAVGVWALDRVDWFMWDHEADEARNRTTAVRPNGEPPAHALVTRIEGYSGRTLSDDQHRRAGKAVHYAIGIGPAMIYAAMRDRMPGSGVGRGALYGFGLFLAQDEGLNTVTGLGARPDRYPWQAHTRGLIAHVAYGVATELALSLFDRIGTAAGRREELAA